MSEPTLYLHNEDAYDLYPGLPDMFRSLVKATVLVPFEPDYEAAKIVMQELLALLTLEQNDRWVAIHAGMVVDAAFGIGGDK